MYLYSLTLQQSTAIQKAIYGNFSAPKAQEIVVSKGKYLELLRPDEVTGKLQIIHSQGVFGIIRNICSFRLTGSSRDYIILCSDSGRIVILAFDSEKNCFQKIHQETYGKTGCRRIVPGQYLAVDPKGRAFMVGAIEKQKFVYILNRDSQAKLTISSPLEAHKSHTLIFDICGIDVGYENPLFACIESDYGEIDAKDSATYTGVAKKFLTFYEMDLGLNHVVRKNMEELPLSAHLLISIPGVPDGPGGLIVCCENFLVYKSLRAGVKELKIPFPRRVGSPTDRNLILNSFSTHKQKDLFFFLLQTELGDLLKLSLHFTEEEVHNVQLQYFDSIPSALSLVILKSGYLFAGCESGNHQFYKFLSIGNNDNEGVTDSTMEIEDIVEFYPRGLKNLALIDELENLSVISDIKIEDLTGEGNPQIYTLCAAGERSTLRRLKHGLAVNELAVSPLPGKPVGIWTIKENVNDEYHKYIVLTFLNQTLVLSIGEKVVESTDSGLELQKSTLLVSLLEDNAIIQVNPNGIRHIRKDKRINQWLTDGKILKAACNPRQLAIAVMGGEIIYFELDNMGNLTEIEKMTVEGEVVCLDIGSIPEGRQRCKFLAVGLNDNTVRVFSLDSESCLHRLSTQALPSQPESVCLLEMKGEKTNVEEESTSQLFLHVGLSNGVLLRTAVDSVTGNLTDTRTRFLGSRPAKCFKILIHNEPSLLALSTRSWVCYNYLSRYFTVPLSYDSFDYAAGFNSAVCAEGIVGISNNYLKIISPDKLGELFNQTKLSLRYSPRKMVVHPETHNLIIIESSHRAFCEREKTELKKQLYASKETFNLPESQIGSLKAPSGCWASCIRIVEPITLKTLDLIEIENNENAVALSTASFAGKEGEMLILVGTVKDLVLQPKSFSCGYVHTYALIEGGTRLQLLHKTAVEDIPYCFAAFKGKILMGVGPRVRMYEMGLKKLLKKAELKGFATGVNTIQVNGERIFVTDLADSIHVLKYRPKMQTFYEFADDILPRWISTALVLDHRTVVAGDKFENVFVCRLPAQVDDEADDDLATYKFKWETGYLNGAAHKMEQICSFYTGELITNINKTALVSTSNEVIIYGTSMGSICALYPFETKEDVDFFVHLEMYLRIEATPLCGRDHIMFRSFYAPVKNVIDGDLCEQFSLMSYNKQKVLSEELDRTPAEVLKKLEDVRNRIL